MTKNVVIANRPPTADFDFSPAAPKKNENVTFTSLASDPENRIQVLEWDLDGDNQYDDAFGPTAQKAFDTPGTKTVRLKVTDSDGGSHTVSKTLTVPSQPPVASFMFSPDAPLSLQRVIFTSTSTGPRRVDQQIRWDTDNDDTSTTATDIEADAHLHDPRRQDGAPARDGRRRQHGHDDPHRASHEPRAHGRDRRPRPRRRRTRTSRSSRPRSSTTSTARSPSASGTSTTTAFDDGTSAQITKSFTTTGPKTIRLRVTDNLGATARGRPRRSTSAATPRPSPAFTISRRRAR